MALRILIITLLINFVLLYETEAADPVRVFNPDAQGTVSMDGAPAHVVDLIQKIKAAEMKHWVLSEEKGSKWRVSRVMIINTDLLLVRLSDGNGAEDVLFDRDRQKNWTIIRRSPFGDWKPKAQRRGERLSALSFPELEGQASSGLPATHPGSKLEGGNNPQPEANASLYSYPEDKQPQITLKQAYEIAESLVVKLGYGQGFFADSASVHGDEEQSGAGTWNLIFRNVKGDKIQFGIYFPQDRCFVAFIPNEGDYTEKEVTRDGKISKQWIEWQEKLRRDEKEAEKVFGPVIPLKKKEKETEP